MMTANAERWAEVVKIAAAAGAKHPHLVAAQYALESGWGQHVSGRHNYFGLKGPGSDHLTTEEVNGQMVTVRDQFLDFDSMEDCIRYLVDRWYKDFKGFKGVNHAASAEEAAVMLKEQGYATDSAYPRKLQKLLRQYGPAQIPAASAAAGQKALFTMTALQNTWLKKRPEQAAELEPGERVPVDQGRQYGVMQLEELAADAHARVTLAAGAGEWFIFMPHWRQSGMGAAVQPAVVNWADFDQRVTPHLTVGEVLQWDARRRPAAGSSAERRILATAQQFEAIRTAWGRPLGVTSFYRPEPINSQKGGVPNSRHVSGEAMDIYPVGLPVDALYQFLRVRWSGGLGDGRHRGFVHLDTRGGGGFVPGAGVRPYVEFGY